MAVKVGRTFVYGDFEPVTKDETLGRFLRTQSGSKSGPEFAVEILRKHLAN